MIKNLEESVKRKIEWTRNEKKMSVSIRVFLKTKIKLLSLFEPNKTLELSSVFWEVQNKTINSEWS